MSDRSTENQTMSEPLSEDERTGIRHDPNMGGLAYCGYCGFGLVTDGPRECCQAGKDVDALLARIKAQDWVCYSPCQKHMGMTFTMKVGYAAPPRTICPICEPPT